MIMYLGFQAHGLEKNFSYFLLSESLCHRELRQYLYIVTLLQCRNLVQKRSDLTMVGMPEEGTAVGESD